MCPALSSRPVLLSCRRGRQAVRRPAAVRGPVVRPVRGRPGGADRAQRLGQVDAAQDPRRPRGAGLRHPLGAQGGAGRLRAAGPRLPGGADGRGGADDGARPASRWRSTRRAPAPPWCSAAWGFRDPGQPVGDALRRLAQAAGHRPRAGPPSPTCCCSTSRPTTSTSRASCGSRSCWRASRSPTWWSATTATSWRTSPAAWSSSTAPIPTGCLQVDGSYSDFLERRDELLTQPGRVPGRRSPTGSAARSNGCAAAPRRGRTKAKARIDEAGRLIGELAEIAEDRAVDRHRAGIDFAASGRKTKKLLVAARPRQALRRPHGARRASTCCSGPGTRLGLLGPNGSGKTTLLSLLAGDARARRRRRSSARRFLKIVLFEQGRETLDRGQPARAPWRRRATRWSSAAGRSTSPPGRKRFLFRSEQLDTPVSRLSGGEQARVLIARLMLQPADVLILDEPTNDLDIPTLEVLEESLLEFPGALVLVTHDRYLLDRVCDPLLALDGRGGRPLFADSAQWEAARTAAAQRRRPRARRAQPAASRRQGAGQAPLLQGAAGVGGDGGGDPGRRGGARSRPGGGGRSGRRDRPRGPPRALRGPRGRPAEVERLYARWAELEAKRT